MQEMQVPLSAGTVIQKRYVVETLQSKGDSGNVYLVRNLSSKNIQHNLLVLKEVIAPNKQERYRLFNEAMALRELHHRGIPRIHQVFNDDKRACVYLLMEYIEGQDLEKLRRKQPEQQFSWYEAMSIMAPIVATVSFLHHQQPPIIHSDIKPANIIVLKAGFNRSVLVAYSPVKEYGAIPIQLSNYKAPEHYTGEASIQADVYALGATFYTLLTGMVPVDALSRIALLNKEGSDPLKQVSEVARAVPAHVGRAVDQAVSLEAHNRFSSADQLWEAFWSPVEQPVLESGSMLAALSRPSTNFEHAVEHLATVSAPEQPVSKPAPASLLNRTSPARPWKLATTFILLVLLIGLGAGSVFWISAESHLAAHATIPTPEVMLSPPVPTSTPTLGLYPSIVGTYNGTIFDLATNISTTLSFTRIQQDQEHISGYLTVGSKLQGSGPFSGTLDTTKRLQFMVTDSTGQAVLFFEGTMQSPTSLSGDYYRCGREQGNRCLQAPGDYGIWNVAG